MASGEGGGVGGAAGPSPEQDGTHLCHIALVTKCSPEFDALAQRATQGQPKLLNVSRGGTLQQCEQMTGASRVHEDSLASSKQQTATCGSAKLSDSAFDGLLQERARGGKGK